MIKKLSYFLIALVFLLNAGYISWIQFRRYAPASISNIQVHNTSNGSLKYGDSLGIMLWNISYGGMPDEMDFFYSGGTQIILDQSTTETNFKNILSKITDYKDSTDIFLFHKVDTSSKRSYGVNQIKEIQQTLTAYEAAYCLNFSNPFIPVPLDQPIGQVYSGMLSMSKTKSNEHKRVSFNSKEYYWPKKLFTAQKCISIASYPLEKKKLYVLNAHLNSYDYQGEIRLEQLKQVEHIADSLYKLGNYIVIAGGWNMNPPGYKKYRIRYGYKGKPAFPELDSTGVFSNWQIQYNASIPTSRTLKDAYRHGAINTTIKDFFICSPNINILRSSTVNQQFEYSDHQAVYLRILLLPN